jgi:hypothetical protein
MINQELLPLSVQQQLTTKSPDFEATPHRQTQEIKLSS